jgi:hypothetical protein
MSSSFSTSQRTPGMITGFATTVTALTALMLIFISFLFESEAMAALLGSFAHGGLYPGLALTVATGLALGLNGAKVALPFVVAQMTAVEGSRALGPHALRGLVLLLSLALTLVIVSSATISPHAVSQFKKMTDEIETGHARSIVALQTDEANRINPIETRFANEAKTLSAEHRTRLADLQKKLDHERTIGGQNFKGAVYLELERLIASENDLSSNRLNALHATKLTEIEAVSTAITQKRTSLDKTRATLLSKLDFNAVSASPEAQEPHIMSLVRIGEHLLPVGVATPVTVTITLSMLISIVIEVTPLLLLRFIFSTFTVTRISRGAGPTVEPENRTYRPREAEPAPGRLGGAPARGYALEPAE